MHMCFFSSDSLGCHAHRNTAGASHAGETQHVIDSLFHNPNRSTAVNMCPGSPRKTWCCTCTCLLLLIGYWSLRCTLGKDPAGGPETFTVCVIKY